LNGLGDAVTINVVLLLPPNDSYNTLVSLLFLYGTKPPLPSVSALITLPKVVNDKLIFFPSSNVYPVAPVLDIFSLPAKSINDSLPVLAE